MMATMSRMLTSDSLSRQTATAATANVLQYGEMVPGNTSVTFFFISSVSATIERDSGFGNLLILSFLLRPLLSFSFSLIIEKMLSLVPSPDIFARACSFSLTSADRPVCERSASLMSRCLVKASDCFKCGAVGQFRPGVRGHGTPGVS